jgi:hypothetical protein
MKKHLGLLCLLLAQDVCAMELTQSPQALKNDKKYKKAVITPEYDEKCKLVAKYLYHYPAGTNKKETHKINRFLIDTRNHIPCTCCKDCKRVTAQLKRTAVLRRYVKKYIKRLHNMEAEEILCTMHTMSFPPELKQRVFTESLRDKAQKDYAINHAMHILNNRSVKLDAAREHEWNYHKLLKQYFLSEISEKNNIIMMFVHGGDLFPSNLYFLSFCYLNCSMQNAKEFHELRNFYHTNFYPSPSNNGRGFYDHPTFQRFSFIQCFCGISEVIELNAYLDARWDRVNAFKNKFTEQINFLLSKNDKEELVEAYINLLKSFEVHLPEKLKHLS